MDVCIKVKTGEELKKKENRRLGSYRHQHRGSGHVLTQKLYIKRQRSTENVHTERHNYNKTHLLLHLFASFDMNLFQSLTNSGICDPNNLSVPGIFDRLLGYYHQDLEAKITTAQNIYKVL